jgi:3-hydroxyacyl-CoA dehydrogenase / enoyl-CoA hydratase / 3-hydroxybutyryl-CoA epimerase
MEDRNAAVKMNFDVGSGIATLTLAMDGKANKIDESFGTCLGEALEWAKSQDGLKGIIVGTAHKDFCVGADIDMLYRERDPARVFEGVTRLNALFRGIETCGVPVVAALTGSALGGGYELALSCHHRIALNEGRIQVGLPEVMLGVIPGAGGTQRLPRLIGIQSALDHLLQGKMVRAPKALKSGLVDDLAQNTTELREKAEAWIAANPKAKQPWDQKDFKYPAPAPTSDDARAMVMVASAMLTKKTAGSMPHLQTCLSALQEGLLLDFDRALEVEGRHFVSLATSDNAKNMIRTLWYHRTAAEKGEGLGIADDHGFRKIGIIGAGMMGAGLAFICAQKGLEVVLKDINAEQLTAGKEHCLAQAKKRMRHLASEEQEAVLNRIRYTLETPDLTGCDLIIEAVVENDKVKHQVTREIEPLLAAGAVYATNTSAIPISHLAKASVNPGNFVGLHFFSPVEQMPLIEIISGEHTSDDTLARSVAFGLFLKKTPIVVNDGYGFYTSRTFAAYLMEAVQMVAEGHNPVLIEWAARQSGMVVPPLKVFDEVTLRLGYHGVVQREQFTGEKIEATGVTLLKTMVEEHDRIGKVAGKGFYDYAGKKRSIWPGLKDLVHAEPENTGVEYIADRLLLAQVKEVIGCLDEGVLRNHRDAEIGAIFGIGFSPGSGGPLSWIDTKGAAWVVDRMQSFADELGDRFSPPESLKKMAVSGATFFERV